MDIAKLVGIILGVPALLIGVLFMSFFLALLFAWPLMWAWNYVIPGLLPLHALTYWQAFSLIIISNLLVKSQTTSK